MRSSKLKNLQRGLVYGVAAAGVLASSIASASPRQFTVDMTCNYPLIGVQPLTIAGEADIPDVFITEEEIPIFDIGVLATLKGLTWTGMNIVQGKSIEGLSFLPINLIAPNRNETYIVVTPIEPQPIPDTAGDFTLDIFAQSPVITPLLPENAGVGEITLGNSMDLEILVRKGDGSKVFFAESDPVTGIFETLCEAVEGSELSLGTSLIQNPITIEAEISVSTDSLDLGTVVSGLTSDATVTVNNVGGEDLVISLVELTGSGASAFMETNDCATVSEGSDCSVTVTYFASGNATHNAQLTIESNDSDEPSTVIDITGTSTEAAEPNIEVDADTVSFGTVLVGSSSDRSVTVSNTGTAALTITGVALAGSSDFSQTNDCGTVAVDATCTIDMTFTSNAAASSSASLTISSNDPDSPAVELDLSGSGRVDTGSIVNISFDIVGDTFILKAKGGADLSGTIDVSIDLMTNDFTADLSLEPTSGAFPLLGSFLGTAAAIEFEQAAQVYGTLNAGSLHANAEMYILLPDIYLTIFSLKIRIGGGEDCRTADTSTFSLLSPEGDIFDPLGEGGTIGGEYVLSKVENCGLFTPIVTMIMSGAGNTLSLDLTN